MNQSASHRPSSCIWRQRVPVSARNANQNGKRHSYEKTRSDGHNFTHVNTVYTLEAQTSGCIKSYLRSKPSLVLKPIGWSIDITIRKPWSCHVFSATIFDPDTPSLFLKIAVNCPNSFNDPTFWALHGEEEIQPKINFPVSLRFGYYSWGIFRDCAIIQHPKIPDFASHFGVFRATDQKKLTGKRFTPPLSLLTRHHHHPKQ